jgi:hypothetical protein
LYFHPNNLRRLQFRICIIFLHHGKNYPEEINLPHYRINPQLQNYIWITYRFEMELNLSFFLGLVGNHQFTKIIHLHLEMIETNTRYDTLFFQSHEA